MKNKRILKDPGFWVLIGINIYLVWYYYQTPAIFTTLIWLYWCQSVMMGIFNFVDMLTVRSVLILPDSDKQENSAIFKSRVPSAFFFAVHYGFFHLAYLIFIAMMKPRYPLNWYLFKYFLMAFFVGQVITFVQHKVQQRKASTNLGYMFFTPYIRIVPMHLTILIPSFLHITNLGIFLILKAVADIIMYIVTKPAHSSRESDQALLVSQQTNM